MLRAYSRMLRPLKTKMPTSDSHHQDYKLIESLYYNVHIPHEHLSLEFSVNCVKTVSSHFLIIYSIVGLFEEPAHQASKHIISCIRISKL